MADVTHIGDAYAWNITRIAEAFGMSRDTVRKRLREAGVQPKGTRGNAPVYLLADVGPALFQGGGEQTAASHQPDKMPPKDRKEWYQSENERLKFQREIGDLFDEIGAVGDAVVELPYTTRAYRAQTVR